MAQFRLGGRTFTSWEDYDRVIHQLSASSPTGASTSREINYSSAQATRLPRITDGYFQDKEDKKMVWEPKGCCCFDLRTGSLILGSLVLAFSVLGLILSINTVVNVDVDLEISKVCADEKVNEAVSDCHTLTKSIVIGFIASRFIIDIIVTILSSLLIHGIRKNMTRMLIPFMVMQLCSVTILLLLALALLGICAVVGLWKALIVLFVTLGSIIFLQTYFLLVIRAFYYEMKRAKSHVHIALKDEVGYTESQRYYESKTSHY